jgi:hypothetical protein
MEEIVDRIWEKFLTDRDRAVLAASGYGSHGGFGKKSALLVIDVSYGFTGDKPAAARAPPAKSQKEIRQPAAARAPPRARGHRPFTIRSWEMNAKPNSYLDVAVLQPKAVNASS